MKLDKPEPLVGAPIFSGTCCGVCPQSIIGRVVEKGSDDLNTEGCP